MKKLLLSAAVILSLSILSTATPASASELEPQLNPISSVVKVENLPSDVKDYLINSGYDLSAIEITYTSELGDPVYNRTRAYQVTVPSALYVEKNSWGAVVATSNARYKTLNVRNGYEATGYYETFVRKNGSNYIYDRIFTYNVW